MKKKAVVVVVVECTSNGRGVIYILNITFLKVCLRELLHLPMNTCKMLDCRVCNTQYTHRHTRTHAHTRTRTHTHTHIHIHTHTHTHTHTYSHTRLSHPGGVSCLR